MPMLPFAAAQLNPQYVLVTVKTRKAEKNLAFKCTLGQLKDGVRKYKKGAYIQDAFSFLTANEREFLMTGMTPEEWSEMFPNY